MITPDQIQITSELVYEGCGLTIGYQVNGEGGLTIMSDLHILEGLLRIRAIESFRIDRKGRTVIDAVGRLRTLDDFMRLNLSTELVLELIADFLNNRTDKDGNYKTYTI